MTSALRLACYAFTMHCLIISASCSQVFPDVRDIGAGLTAASFQRDATTEAKTPRLLVPDVTTKASQSIATEAEVSSTRFTATVSASKQQPTTVVPRADAQTTGQVTGQTAIRPLAIAAEQTTANAQILSAITIATTKQATTNTQITTTAKRQLTINSPTTTKTTEQTTTNAPIKAKTTEQTTTSAPITTKTTEQTTTSAPVTTKTTEQTTTSAPITTKTIEQTTTSAPITTKKIEQATTNAPIKAKTTEQTTTNLPYQATTTEQQKATNAQTATTKTEHATTNALITTTTTEQSTTIKAPMKTTATELETTNAPIITTTEQTTTNAPIVTKTEQTTSKAPIITTTEQTTTNAPIITTTEKTTTNAPIITTTEQTTTNAPIITTTERTTTNAPIITTTERTKTNAPITTTTTERTKTNAPITTTTTERTTTNAPIATTTTEQTTATKEPITTTVTLSTSLTPPLMVQQTLQPYCRLRLHSNLFECAASNSRDQTRSSSKSDDNRLDLLLPAVGSRSLCCRDSNKSVRHPDGLARGPRISVNCSMMSPNRELSPEILHCSDKCNATLRLSPSNRYYSLFLPLHDVPSTCNWRLEGVTQVTISANSNLKRKFPRPFLCLARGGMSAATCFSLAQELSPAVTAYPLSVQPPQLVNITCGGDCYLHYSWAAARMRLAFRSFKIELIRQQEAEASNLPTTGSTGADRVHHRQGGDAPSATIPFEFRVTRGVLAGVLASGIILLGVAFCIWAYRSWQYRMYSSPLRRLVGRTPLHRLPAYSSRMFELQLDRPSGSSSSRKASSTAVGRASLTSSSLSAAAASAAGTEGVEEEELLEMTEEEAAGSAGRRQRRLEIFDGAVNRGFRM